MNTYIIHLQQLSIFLQRRLRDTNFNASSWQDIQNTLNEHVRFTQSLARLPAPAQNRLQPQRVDVFTASIPMVIVRSFVGCEG